MTYPELIAKCGLKMTATRALDNPNMENSNQMDHWRCTIRNKSKQRIWLIFSMGFAHNGKKPKLAEVLDCMASDATVGWSSFESWCADLGMDSDSRKAERTFNACVDQTKRLKRIMGDDFDNLLNNVERL